MNRADAAKLARAARLAKLPSIEERFWSKVDIREPDECWPWTAAPRNKRSQRNYGAFWLNGRHHPANKIAWELKNGLMPQGMFACHRCDNPSCCNPSHIFPGTTQENTADKVRKGRQVKGELVHTAKLSKQDVIDIRNMLPPNTRAPRGLPGKIAEKYGITKQYVSEIWGRKSWRSL